MPICVFVSVCMCVRASECVHVRARVRLHMCMNVSCACGCASGCACELAYVRMFVCAYAYMIIIYRPLRVQCVRTCVHTCVRTCVCTCVYACAFERICVRVCGGKCVRVCGRNCVLECIGICECARLRVPAAHVSMCASARVHAFADSRTCGCAYVHVYYAYMIYHIGLYNMTVTLGTWGLNSQHGSFVLTPNVGLTLNIG